MTIFFFTFIDILETLQKQKIWIYLFIKKMVEKMKSCEEKGGRSALMMQGIK